ncbi:hypothetical protein GJ496_005235 [Pomphorhynchus laevis]|nr:hypothetical protein GJ496_005235 [Pomphorhynchus laevis]
MSELNQIIDCLSTDLHSTKLTVQAAVNVGNCDVDNRCITQVNNRFTSENVDKQRHVINYAQKIATKEIETIRTWTRDQRHSRLLSIPNSSNDVLGIVTNENDIPRNHHPCKRY